MMKKVMVGVVMFLLMVSSFANAANDTHRYQETKLVVKNHAPYPVLLTMNDVDGRWKIPVALKQPILLNENERYENTVISTKKDGDVENFVSLDVAQVDNARENYLIFAESTSGRDQSVSAHIFDGLGSIFVKSETNHCDASTMSGYGYCELVIQ